MAATPVRYYGAHPDPHDPGDYTLHFPPEKIPAHGTKDLRRYVREVYHQRSLNSCTANAVCAAYEISLIREGKQYFKPSRLFVYYNTRSTEHSIHRDSGVKCLKDVIGAISEHGICRETSPKPYWPYHVRCFEEKPPPECYESAKGNTIDQFEKLKNSSDIHQIRACLDHEYPLVFGFKVFRNFHASADTGILAMPSQSDREDFQLKDTQGKAGRHAVVAVGYDDNKERVTILNSWGPHWGNNGYFEMPYAFITNPDYCFDFWKIESATEEWPVAQKTNHWAVSKTRREAWPEHTSNPHYIGAVDGNPLGHHEKCCSCCSVM